MMKISNKLEMLNILKTSSLDDQLWYNRCAFDILQINIFLDIIFDNPLRSPEILSLFSLKMIS